MKNILTLLLICALSLISRGQQTLTGTIQLTYNYVNVGLSERRSVKLLVRMQESLSQFSQKDSINTGAEAQDFNIGWIDSIGNQVYKNTSTGMVIFRDFVPENGEFNACIVSDPMKPMTWVHSTETRKIGRYLCRAAATEFRGRSYIAYFTEEIPISHGPWKFSGLPGAIVEVYSKDRNISFTLVQVATSTMEIKKPSHGKPVSMAYYVTRHEKALGEFIEMLRSKLPRGAQITATTSGSYSLETDFSDVKK